MAIQKLNIPNKTDNAAKKKMVQSNTIGANETLMANEVNALVAKTNELVDATNNFTAITGFNFKENKATYADLASIVDPQKDDAYGVLADGLIYIYNGESWPTEGNGLDLKLRPTGTVAEGVQEAVSGGEVYNTTLQLTDFNKIYDKINVLEDLIPSNGNKGTNYHDIVRGYRAIVATDWNNLKSIKIPVYVINTNLTNLDFKVRLFTRDKSSVNSNFIVKNTLYNQTINHVVHIGLYGYSYVEIVLDDIYYNTDNDDLCVDISTNTSFRLLFAENPDIITNNILKPKLRYTTSNFTDSTSLWEVVNYLAYPIYVEIKESINNYVPRDNQVDYVLTHIVDYNHTHGIATLDKKIFENSFTIENVDIINSYEDTDTPLRWFNYTGSYGQCSSVGYQSKIDKIGVSVKNVDTIDLTDLRLRIYQGSNVLIQQSYTDLIIPNSDKYILMELDDTLLITDESTEVFVEIRTNAKSVLRMCNSKYSILNTRHYTTATANTSTINVTGFNNYDVLFFVYKKEERYKPVGEVDLTEVIEKTNKYYHPENSIINIPDTIYSTQGEEMNIYRDSIYNSPLNTNIDLLIISNNIAQRDNRIVYNGSVLTDFNMSVIASNGFNNIIEQKNIIVKTTAKTSALGVTKTALHIGDSLTEQNSPTKWILDKLTTDGGGTCDFIGYRLGQGVRHQGTSGWSWSSYLSKTNNTNTIEVFVSSSDKTASDINSIWSDGVNEFKLDKIWSKDIQLQFTPVIQGNVMVSSGTLTHVSGGVNTSNIVYSKAILVNGNPFYDAETNTISLVKYCQKAEWDLPDIISIYLGTNDIGQGVSTITDESLNSIVTNARNFINILTSATTGNPNAKIILNLIPYGSGSNSMNSFRQRAMRLNAKYINEFKSDSNVIINSTNLVIDRKLGYPELTTAEKKAGKYYTESSYESQQVHYNNNGAKQIGDQLYNAFKYVLNN